MGAFTLTTGLSDPRASGNKTPSENQVHMEYIRVRQNAEVKTNQHDLKKIINPLDLGSKAKMEGSARHSTSPLQLGTLLNFCLLVAACIIISCTVKSAEAKPSLEQYNTVGGETIDDIIDEERNG